MKILIALILIAFWGIWFVVPHADPEEERFNEFSKIDLCKDIKMGEDLKYIKEYFTKIGFEFRFDEYPYDERLFHAVFWGKSGMTSIAIIYSLRIDENKKLLNCSKDITYTFL